MKTNRKKKSSFLYKLIIFLIIVLMGTLGAAYWHYNESLKSVQPNSEPVAFTVESGASLREVCADLEEQGIIRNSKMAFYYARFHHLNNIKAGDFTLDKGWDVNKIFTYLNDELAANQDTVNVTITEGDWAKDAAKKIAAETTVSEEDLLALWNDEKYIRSMMESYPFLTDEMFNENIRIYMEGYLAPDTYQFFRETSAEEVTKRILDQSLIVYNQYADEIAENDLSIHQFYTLASIVQHEAGRSSMEDMEHVASVFYNRMKIDMALQSSSTVCYAIDFDKETDHWMACETNPDFDSPYNTYKYPGLTPGPIMNVGKLAIEATLHPTDDEDLYFVADVSTGEIHFAKTLEEHNANVAKYMQ